MLDSSPAYICVLGCAGVLVVYRGRLRVAVLLDSPAPLPAPDGLNSQSVEALEIDGLRLDIGIREILFKKSRHMTCLES